METFAPVYNVWLHSASVFPPVFFIRHKALCASSTHSENFTRCLMTCVSPWFTCPSWLSGCYWWSNSHVTTTVLVVGVATICWVDMSVSPCSFCSSGQHADSWDCAHWGAAAESDSAANPQLQVRPQTGTRGAYMDKGYLQGQGVPAVTRGAYGVTTGAYRDMGCL